jgi:hypothetical protein
MSDQELYRGLSFCGDLPVRRSADSEIKIKLKFDLDAPAPNFERDWNLPPLRPMLVAIRSVVASARRR